MAKYLPLPKSLAEADKAFVRDTITATEEVFKGDLFGETNRPPNEPYTTHDGKYHWATNKDLLVYVTELTNTGDIKAANASLYRTLSIVPEYGEPTMMGAPESLSKTSLSSIESEELIEKYEKREAERAKTYEHDTDVRVAIDRQKEIYRQRLQKIAAAEKELKDKEVYVKHEPKLDGEKQKALETLSEEVNKDPIKAFQLIREETRSRVDDSIPDGAVTITALNIVANIQSNSAPAAQSTIIESVANGTLVLGGKEVKDLASVLSNPSLTLESLNEQTHDISKQAFGNEFAQAVIPLNISVSETAAPDYHPMSLGFIPPVARSVIETQSAVLQKPNTNSESHIKSFVERWQAEIAKGNVQGGAFRAIEVQKSLTYFPRGASASWQSVGGDAKLNLSTGLSEPMGIVGGLAKMGVQKAAGKAVGAVAAKTGLKAAFSKVAASLGAAGGPITAAAAWIGAEILSRINLAKIKKYSLMFVSALTLAAGLAFGVPLLSIAGVGGLGAGWASAQGMTLGGIGSGIGGFFGALAGATLGAIGMPILFTLIGFPIIVALILFIINSGAYIVPPSLSSLANTSQNEYISVTKTANPSGPFQNSNLPLKITYTITITAKKEALSNVTAKHTCNATTKSGNKGCPAPDIPAPSAISVGAPFTFTYDADYDNSYQDAYAINTVSVSARVTSESNTQETAASASLKIGNPPDVCPNGWPVSGSWMITQTPGGSYSHASIQAMDIATSMGTGVTSTSTGIATVVYTKGPYAPVYVDVESTCGGKQIKVRYAHFSVVLVNSGDPVPFGQVIGRSGTGGSGPHLHYEFIGIPMAPPYIPRALPRCSSDGGGCGFLP